MKWHAAIMVVLLSLLATQALPAAPLDAAGDLEKGWSMIEHLIQVLRDLMNP